MSPKQILIPAVLAVALAASAVYQASAADADQPLDFNRDVRPILAGHCFACHGQDEKKREAGLRLDMRDAATAAAESGEIAIAPGKSNQSELIHRVTSDDDSLRMPPVDTGERLTGEQVATLRRWIDAGAEYAEHWAFVPPRRAALPQVGNKQWPRTGIDFFVLAELERNRLKPSSAADRYALIRRLSLDLRGLPPTPSEVKQFVEDNHPDAYEQLVDRLLADPKYGERWARMWLDLARYADSKGYGSDPLREIWRYRDWVIDAFNRNLPYDQFTIQQLAGDLLPAATLDQRIATAMHRNTMTNTEGGTDDEEFRVAAVKDRVDSTMQIWMGLTMGCAKCHSHKYDPITQHEYYQFFAFFNQTADSDRPDEAPTIEAPTPVQVAQLKRANQKLTQLRKNLAVAQAKPLAPVEGRYVRIDIPAKQKLLSLAEVQVLRGDENLARAGRATQSSTAYEGPAALAIDGNTDGDYFKAKSTTHTATEDNPWWEIDLGANQAVEKVVVFNRTDGGLQKRLVNFRIQLLDEQRRAVWQVQVPAAPNPRKEFPTASNPEASRIQAEISRLEKSRPKPARVPVMMELADDKHRTTQVMVRGNFLNLGEVVQPGFPAAFHAERPDARRDRLGMAQWLVDRNNPLTARVAVNRMWAQLFGVGLVETEEDFGTQGELPSHHALLDWLAIEFMERNWDTKSLLREILTSQTYRQSSRVTPDRLAADPRNRLFSRGPRFRLEAEMVRDQAMALSGLLSTKLGGPSVYPPQPPGLWRAAFNGRDRKWATDEGEDRYRRGLYTFWRRTVPYPSMEAFDAPSREICKVRRIRTNTPLQAFVTLNDPVYIEAAGALARRIMREGGEDTHKRIRFALELCLCRPAKPVQVEYLAELYASEREHFRQDQQAADMLVNHPLHPLPAGIDKAELAAWTVIANVLLNLDGVLTKG